MNSPTNAPPTIDPVALQRWQAAAPLNTPWLHDEVARRMFDRLGWITMQPTAWLHWKPLQHSAAQHALLCQHYPKAQAQVWQTPLGTSADETKQAKQALRYLNHSTHFNAQPTWAQRLHSLWQSLRQSAPVNLADAPSAVTPANVADMLWGNMQLHQHAAPQALIQQWFHALRPDGFLMFSALGPDSLLQLQQLYASKGWGAPAQAFTDMHDWGDMLINAGFSQPVMDVEHITLSYTSPQALLAELRTLGRNLHPQRHAGLRGKTWLGLLHTALEGLRQTSDDGRIHLRFEIIYGHAIKPAPSGLVKADNDGVARVPLAQLRSGLRRG